MQADNIDSLKEKLFDFFIFSRTGQLLYSIYQNKPDDSEFQNRLKFIFGLIWSLKSFSKLVNY